MSKIGTSILGCGNVARVHARALSDIEESRLVAVCDIVPERAKRFALTYGVKKWFTDYRKMVKDPEVETVNICTPHPLHAGPAIAAAEAGKHVAVEKPIAANLKQADAMLAAARKGGIKMCVMFQRRLYDACQKMRSAIDDGKLGTPIIGEAHYRGYREKEYYDSNSWRGKWGTEGGGVYINQMVHEIDLLQWFMSSPVDSVYALAANLTHPYVEVEDNAVTVLSFQNGAFGLISGSNSVNPPLDSRITITGSKGAVVGIRGLDPFWIETWTIKGEEKQAEEWRRQELKVQSEPDFLYYDTYTPYICHKRLVRKFLQAVIDDKEPPISGEEGRKALEIIVASYISSATGKAVKFPVKGDHPYHTRC